AFTTTDAPEGEAPEASTTSGRTNATKPTSRRALLKWGGLGAAALAATGGAALTIPAAPTAHAASGSHFVLGQSNTAGNMTALTFDIGSGVTDTVGLFVDASPNTQVTTGIVGVASPGGIGIEGESTGGAGVKGINNSGTGVGVSGFSASGFGVEGQSVT